MIQFKKHKKAIAVLIDPGKLSLEALRPLVELAIKQQVDYFFIGGSLMTNNSLEDLLLMIKSACDIPCVLYPGSTYQISSQADACLFMSLVSGRNPEYLIGQQVLSAPLLAAAKLQTISTAYMLIADDIQSSVAYMSQTLPIPSQKTDLALATALAADMLGFSCLFIDAGSGAKHAVPTEAIQQISKHINKPLLVGGGIDSKVKAEASYLAGADVVVVGNALEKNIDFLKELVELRNSFLDKQLHQN
ncbi:MAG: geranylgeranylglyceryl/heptaprenylglyceryl phosphate synthase [Flavobacteriales bacterium]